MTITIGCVLKTGGEFNWAAAMILRDSVARNAKGHDYQFRVLSDDPGHDDAVKIRHDLPGWWSKMELFSPEVRETWGDTLYFDLDTAITGDLTPIINYCKTDWRDPTGGTPFTILRDFYRPNGYGSGVMFIPGTMTGVWGKWQKHHTNLEIGNAHNGDQNFLEQAAPGALRWQDVLPGKIASFKPVALPGATRASLPDDCRVLCFHGKPRPWELPADHWTRRYWRANPTVVVNNDRELVYAGGVVAGEIVTKGVTC